MEFDERVAYRGVAASHGADWPARCWLAASWCGFASGGDARLGGGWHLEDWTHMRRNRELLTNSDDAVDFDYLPIKFATVPHIVSSWLSAGTTLGDSLFL